MALPFSSSLGKIIIVLKYERTMQQLYMVSSVSSSYVIFSSFVVVEKTRGKISSRLRAIVLLRSKHDPAKEDQFLDRK